MLLDLYCTHGLGFSVLEFVFKPDFLDHGRSARHFGGPLFVHTTELTHGPIHGKCVIEAELVTLALFVRGMPDRTAFFVEKGRRCSPRALKGRIHAW